MYCIDPLDAADPAHGAGPARLTPRRIWGGQTLRPSGPWRHALPRSGQLALALLLACGVVGCNSPVPTSPGAGQVPQTPQARPQPPAGTPGRQTPAAPAPTPLAAPSGKPARDWDTYRAQAARRIVAANPAGTYMGEVPEPLLAIPVLEVELNGDGSVRRIVVKRQPRQAQDTVQLAIAAVHRAAPFASVAHLPRPWQFVEVFLFDDDRRFKPRSLD